ncbi:MAG TPA: LemA family protein [Leptolyngbyaceae cyanobacterium]
MADLRIPEDKALEVFELASQLYARQNQSYAADAGLKAGSAADIPPEYIHRALTQLQAREEAVQARKHRHQELRYWLQVGGVATAGVILGCGVLVYESLARASQRVDLAWSQVENQLQSRADLIPNLVGATLGSAQPAKDLATQLNQVRHHYDAAATQSEKVAAAENANQAFARFQASVLTPQAQANPRYQGLKTKLMVTENRIAVERVRYNQFVVQYNQQVQAFPNSLVSDLLGFEPKPLFEASTPEASKSATQPTTKS